MLPKVFIGSTQEAKDLAQEISNNLKDICEPLLWYKDVFQISSQPLESLLKELKKCDFAIFILTADDYGVSREQKFFIPRDNLIFEAGMSFVSIGKDRTFIIPESREGKMIKIPTDLDGFTLTSEIYKTNNTKQDIVKPMDEIKKAINKLGCKEESYGKFVEKADVISRGEHLIELASKTIWMFGHDLSWANDYENSLKKAIYSGKKITAVFVKPECAQAHENKELLEDIGTSIIMTTKDLGLRSTITDHEDYDNCYLFSVIKTRKVYRWHYQYEQYPAKKFPIGWKYVSAVIKQLLEIKESGEE
jgi:hypothetical protein